MFDWSLIQSEIDVAGHHYLQGETRDLCLSGLSYLRNRAVWHSSDTPLTDAQWDALDAALARATEDVIVPINVTPVGAVEWYAGLDPLPAGWLLCDGTIYNIADYPLLGARLGATYGGNGITTFAVPSLDEKFIRGTELEAELGDEAGSDTVTLQTANLPAHTHDYGYPSVGVDVEAPGVPDFTAVGNPPTTLQTSSVGDGDSFSVTNPYLKLRPIIRALGDTVVEIEIPVLPAVPVGATILWWGAPPTGWLDCSGQNISKTTYPELFAVIGYTYGGSGDTFNLPNTAGRTVFGLYPDLPPFGQFGDTGGEVEHALTAAEMPAHAHNVRLNLADGTSPQVPSLTTNRSPATNFGQTQSAGDGDPHNNMPPFITGGFIIKITP